MTRASRAGAVIYAKDLAKLSAFYQQLLSMQVLKADTQHEVLNSADFQLVLHAIPPHIAATITIPQPLAPREDAAIKLYFSVDSLADAKRLSESLGGAVFDNEWAGPGFRMRNGCDPEGNIFQLRQWH